MITSDATTQEILTSRIANMISWLSAFLGLGTAAGVVSLLVGLLSSLWLSVQLINYVRFTLPANKRAKYKMEKEIQESK